MNIKITGKDLEVTDSIKNYINEKVAKLEKNLGDEFDCVATIKLEGKEQVCELRVNVNLTGEIFKAVTASHDLYFSIDKDIEILEGQIRKSKSKNDQKNMTDSIRLKENNLSEENDIEGEIIKTLYYDIKPLTPEDAKLILEGEPKNKFKVFINVDTNKVNVVYRLKDGKNFGLVEPA